MPDSPVRDERDVVELRKLLAATATCDLRAGPMQGCSRTSASVLACVLGVSLLFVVDDSSSNCKICPPFHQCIALDLLCMHASAACVFLYLHTRVSQSQCYDGIPLASLCMSSAPKKALSRRKEIFEVAKRDLLSCRPAGARGRRGGGWRKGGGGEDKAHAPAWQRATANTSLCSSIPTVSGEWPE